MFTGIITGTGRITTLAPLGEGSAYGMQLTVQTPAGYLEDVALGDSIALNGACMTVTRLDAARHQFCVDISAESLARTTGLNRPNTINLEKALRASDRLGGHIVSGHVDGIGYVTHFARHGESHALHIAAPADMARYLAYKGSVAVNGVSLTVNHVQDHVPLPHNAAPTATGCEIRINLIPHTLTHTALHTLQTGAEVNLEIDLMARYCERMLSLRGGE